MLLVKVGETLMVVPLSLVARLDRLPRDRLELAGGQVVAQYNGRLMPLVAISGTLDLAKPEQSVLVFTGSEQDVENSRSLGLVVDAIVDVIEDVLLVQLTGSRPGILGVAVVGGQAVEVIDTGFWLTRVYPNWLSAAGGVQTRSRLLVVEDSAFFRQLLVPSLGSEGFEVTAVADGEQALALCHPAGA